MQDEWVLCRIIHKSGEKTKPRSFQPQQTCHQESSPLSVPSPISPPPLLLDTSQTIDHNNIRLQAALHNLHRHENGLDSFNMNNPHFMFQPNPFPFGLNLDTHFCPPSIQGTNTDFHGHFNPQLLFDGGGGGSREASSFAVDGGALVDVAAYAGGRSESDENWSGGR